MRFVERHGSYLGFSFVGGLSSLTSLGYSSDLSCQVAYVAENNNIE